MAHLARCPLSLCRRPHRVDVPPDYDPGKTGFPVSRCPGCGVTYCSWTFEGVVVSVELPPDPR